MPYIGSSASPLPVNFAAVQAQSFNGTGSQTDFTLSRSVNQATSIEVLVDNVQQSPYDGSYSVTGTTLSFSGAPPSGTNNVYVVFRDQALGSLTDSTAYRKTEVDALIGAVDLSSRVAKTGDTMTGRLNLAVSTGKQLTVAQWGDVSGADGGQSMIAGNAYFDKTSGQARYSNSHGYIGAVGVRFNSPSWNGGSLFTSGGTGSTQDATFTPVDALKWDSAGRVTMPYQPSFKAQWASASFNFGSGVTLWDQAIFDIGGNYNPANGRFTAPVAGAYHFVLQTQHYGGSTAAGYHDIRLNGGDLNCRWEDTNSASTWNAGCVSVTIRMNAGDWVDCYSSGAIWWSDNSFFCGHLVG